MYSYESFPSCCGAKIIHDVGDMTSGDIKFLNKNYYSMKWADYTLYAIINVNRQSAVLKRFYTAGWVNSGRKWVANSGNTLQTIVRYPIKRK